MYSTRVRRNGMGKNELLGDEIVTGAEHRASLARVADKASHPVCQLAWRRSAQWVNRTIGRATEYNGCLVEDRVAMAVDERLDSHANPVRETAIGSRLNSGNL